LVAAGFEQMLSEAQSVLAAKSLDDGLEDDGLVDPYAWAHGRR
jgi:hypothetical protein